MTEQAQPSEQAPDSLDGIEYVGMSDAPDTSAEPEAKAAEPLELGGEEAPEATPEQVAEEKTKTRSKRWETRVDNLTARLRDAERRAAEAEAKTGSAAPSEPSAPDPNDEKYEFGMADPNYIKDAALFEVRKELADERKREAETTSQNEQLREIHQRVDAGLNKIEKVAAERYPDLKEKLGEAIEARGGEKFHGLLTLGVAASPVGADVLNHLVENADVTEKLEKLANENVNGLALAFGEIEGQHMEDDDDSDLNPANPFDLARMLGRERARRKGLKATERKVSKAPEPPENRARGASGRFEPDWSADNADLSELGKLLR